MIISCKPKKLDFATYTQTQKYDGGGGTGFTNNGGVFYAGCNNQQCQWLAIDQASPVPPPYQTSLGVTRGPCFTSEAAQCWGGECGVLNNSSKAENKADFAISSTTTATFNVTCIDGLETTSGKTESFYNPTTAELVCRTSSNSGVDVTLTGTFQEPAAGECNQHFNLAEEFLVMPGLSIPLKPKSVFFKTYSCGAAGETWQAEIYVPASTICSEGSLWLPHIGDDKCELYGVITGTGKYANTKVDGFKSVSWQGLSETLKIKPSTAKTKFDAGQTSISFSNAEITFSDLSNNSKSMGRTVFYADYQNSVITSSSYNLKQVFDKRTSGTDTVMVASDDGIDESEITTSTLFTKNAPCDSTKTSVYEFTITKLAGLTSESTISFSTTTQIGDYYLYDFSTSARTYAVYAEAFNFSSQSTIEGESSTSNESDAECIKTFPPNTYSYLETEESVVAGGPESPYPTTFPKVCPVIGTYAIDLGNAAQPTQTNPDPLTFNANCNVLCSAKSITCVVAQEPQVGLSNVWCGSEVGTVQTGWENCGNVVFGFLTKPKTITLSSTVVVETPVAPETVKQKVNGKTSCTQKIGSSYGQSVDYLMITETQTGVFHGKVFSSREWENGILYTTSGKQSLSFASTFSIMQKESFLTNKHVFFAFNDVTYNPMAGRTTMFSDAGKTTYIALATGPDTRAKGHPGDIHSYMISDPAAYKKTWEQASWPGYGVLRGQISTGTFKLSFVQGAATQKYAGLHSGYVGLANNPNDPRKIKVTLAADGGLNLIRSKGNISDTGWVETFSTSAFTTSFDSSFKGAFFAKNVMFTNANTIIKTVNWANNCFDAGVPLAHCGAPACVPKLGEIGVLHAPNLAGLLDSLGRRVDDQATYYERGDMSDVFLHNKVSYLWTNPVSSFRWGDGHGTTCPD